MAEHGFTPGPWVASYVGAGRRVTPIYSRGRVVAEARDEVGDRCNDFNARLIAASPTLLEAARKALNFIKNTESEMGEPLDSGNALRAAITLATGKDA